MNDRVHDSIVEHAVAEERERCATLCDLLRNYPEIGASTLLTRAATLIREGYGSRQSTPTVHPAPANEVERINAIRVSLGL